MLGFFFNATSLTPALKARVAPFLDDGEHLYAFSNKSRNALFPLKDDAVGSAFQPLKRGIFDSVVVDSGCDFFASTFTLDWLANIANSLKLGGTIRLPKLFPDVASAKNQIAEASICDLLGAPRAEEKDWLVFDRTENDLAINRSIFGGFLQARGEFVLNAVFGGATNEADLDRAKEFFAPILAPDAPAPRAHLRLPRAKIVEIVERTRAGELGSGVVADIAEVAPPAPWSLTDSAAQLQSHLNSWQNYLMQGTYYKAATLARIIEDHFGPDRPVSFLEHGGYAGTLSLQLLLEERISIEYARCCEIERFTLLNAFEMYQRLYNRVGDRFHMQISSAEDAVYTRKYDVIMFSHVLLYLRRDLLDKIISKAFEHVRPGGMLVVFENTAPPTGSGGNDDDIIFNPEELDSYFYTFGEVEYAYARSGAPAERSERSETSLFRILRKAH